MGGTAGTFTLTRTRTGTALPNWRTIIAAGGNATTALTARWESGYVDSGGMKVTYIGTNISPTQIAGYENITRADPARTGGSPTRVTYYPPAVSSTFADNMARSKFYKKLRREAVQFSAPTFLGELRETLQMLRRPASALYGKSKGYLDALSKEKARSPKDWTKRLSGLWLEHSFGWLPLINDAKDAAEALGRLVTGGNRKSVISGSYQDFIDRTQAMDDYQKGYLRYRFCTGGFNDWRASCKLTEEIIVRYKAKVENTVAMTTWDNWALFGFTPSELIPTAWELLPWSFLVDYFTNVGDVLNSAVTDAKKVCFVNKTVRSVTRFSGHLTPDADMMRADQSIWCKKALVENVVEPEWELNRKDVSRSALATVPLPQLQVKFDLGQGQLANIAALLGQARALHPQNRPRRYIRNAGWNVTT